MNHRPSASGARSGASTSGRKYVTPQGFTAIKDGIKAQATVTTPAGRKPAWLRAPFPAGERFDGPPYRALQRYQVRPDTEALSLRKWFRASWLVQGFVARDDAERAELPATWSA